MRVRAKTLLAKTSSNRAIKYDLASSTCICLQYTLCVRRCVVFKSYRFVRL